MTQPACRFCETPLLTTFCDLGASPLSNSFLRADQLQQMEPFYPLHVYVCDACLLVQLPQFETREAIFSDYVYFSSYSDSWLAHAKAYVDMIVARLGLTPASRVVEVASNDGYLLKYFNDISIPALGVEPASNVAEVARANGVDTFVGFFGEATARDIASTRGMADLIIGNNVLAHVPDINDFVAGLSVLLAPGGTITMEFPHLARLIADVQFDTIYHEHFSYLSLLAVERIFAKQELTIYDVEELPTHGGSLRIFAGHIGDHAVSRAVEVLRRAEENAGLSRLETYSNFEPRVRATKRHLLDFLITAKQNNKSIAAYGAAAKGNTLLNYCGVRGDFIDFVVDRNPHKQGRFLPGTHVPVLAPDHVKTTRPDYLLILPWNIRNEIIEQMSFIREWGGKFVVPVPSVRIVT